MPTRPKSLGKRPESAETRGRLTGGMVLLGATVLAEWWGRHERHILRWPIVRWWIGRAKIRQDRQDIRAFARRHMKRRAGR